MAIKKAKVIINLGYGVNDQGHLMPQDYLRLDTTLRLFREFCAPRIITTGGWGYLTEPPGKSEATESGLGKQYLVSKGISKAAILIEDKSRDSIGNFVFTKQHLLVPNGWDSIIVVTSKSHLPRSIRIARLVCGNNYTVQGVAAPEKIGPRQLFREASGYLTLNYITKGIEPGDDEAIKQRLIERMPGYGGKATKRSLIVKSLMSLLKIDAGVRPR